MRPALLGRLKTDKRLRARGMGQLEGKVWEEGCEYPIDAETDDKYVSLLISTLYTVLMLAQRRESPSIMASNPDHIPYTPLLPSWNAPYTHLTS
jgi:hypothetical protein